MDEREEVNVLQLMEYIHAQARQHRQDASTPWYTQEVSEVQLQTDLAALQRDHDIVHLHVTSHRRWLGKLIVRVKTVLYKLLMPVLARQSAYNTTNARVAASLLAQLTALKQSSPQVQHIQALEERLAQMERQVAQLQALSPRPQHEAPPATRSHPARAPAAEDANAPTPERCL